MTTTEWIINVSLIVMVLRQVQTHRIDTRFVLIPLALVGYSAHAYLQSIPIAGNDLGLVVGFAALGALLGLVGGLATRVRAREGFATAQAGVVSAGLWVGSMGARLAFLVWAENGGGASLTRFSARHDITSADAWSSALVLMAVAEVVVRIATIIYRSRTAPVAVAQPAPMAALATG